MPFDEATELLEQKKASAIRRKAWEAIDDDACIRLAYDEYLKQHYVQFCSCNTHLYDFGPWGGTQEDLDARDWEAIEWNNS